ncbi:MAG: tagaturonate epimerase family protein [Chloroflexi bacterium]|nr:tagaturonate epimerase family protein [Chloroflexota bacterium]MBU1750957.1 tagaturonate epimerase family protein [Chloroflexota bacterium]
MTHSHLSPAECAALSGLTVYPRSVSVAAAGAVYFLGRDAGGLRQLGIVQPGSAPLDPATCGLDRTVSFDGQVWAVRLCPADARHAAVLRAALPHLRPQPLGLSTSVGLGDRLGRATPGHVRAVQGTAPGASVTPVFAQQSIRENARTGRTPQQVIDDATWGLFQEGWRAPWGADADHLKTPADIDVCAAAGFTMYTIDPGDHVDNTVQSASPSDLRDRFHALPWNTLEDSPSALDARYQDRVFEFGDLVFKLDVLTLVRAAAKYGRAIAHVTVMARHLAQVMGDHPYEVEVSVDETETPTSPAEHVYIATELRRLGVQWASLAPRFVGRFEKGVDYIGDPSMDSGQALAEFEAEFAQHAAIAWHLGPYKLSLHSGSDKFSIYPIAARHTEGLIHVKTAGTSYLEALRTIARVDPALFRDILALARAHYEADRASYHVSADVGRVPPPEVLRDDELPALLDDFHAREVLHVTFGSALDVYGDRLRAVLDAHEETYYAALEAHLGRHLAPFAA